MTPQNGVLGTIKLSGASCFPIALATSVCLDLSSVTGGVTLWNGGWKTRLFVVLTS